jgi:predicted PurR-regulated permease PerM
MDQTGPTDPRPPQTDRPSYATGPAAERPSTQTVALVSLTVLAGFYTLKLAASLILPFLIAASLNLVLQPAKHMLHRRLRVPAPLAALVLILGLFGVVGAVGAAISVPASGWIARAPDGWKILQERLQGLSGPIHFVENALHEIENLMQQAPAGGSQPATPPSGGGGGGGGGGMLSTLIGFGLSVLQGTGAAAAQLLTLLVVLFFMLASGDTLLRRLVEVMPTFDDKRRVVDIAQEIERNVSGYLLTISLMNLLVGTANGISMWLCGVPDPLLWGSLAFLLNYIPILGPFIGIIIFFFVGLFVFPTVWLALLPAGIYLVIHVIEGETVTPMLLANRFTFNPVLVIASLFFWDYMWGVIGALLAFPLLAVVKIVCDRIPPLMPLGHLLGGPPRPARPGGTRPVTG